MIEDRIHKINKVVQKYFEKNSNIQIVPAKDLMPEFIEAGIYDKDNRNGLPIRKDLRDLDSQNELEKIPSVLALRKKVNANWYFIATSKNRDEALIELSDPAKTKSKKPTSTKGKRINSDESYILNLCDEILGLIGSRQHQFEFLLGDLHKDGITRTKLPCDIYYPELKLVIEYNESQHTESVKHFDKPYKTTISGVHRGEQRRRYDERRRKVLPEHGIKVIDFSYSDFEHKSKKRLNRIKEQDLAIITRKLESNDINLK